MTDAAPDTDTQRWLRMLEAMLFASAAPIAEEDLAERLPEGSDVKALLQSLAQHYEGRGVTLLQVAGKWAFRTAPDLAEALSAEITVTRKLSRAAIETMAIIAYHQPVTRAEIEQIRGVALSRGTLDMLMAAAWIRPKGRRQTPGRPATWVTTEGFLDHFGLDRLDDLPGVEELRAAGLLDRRPGVTIAMRDEDVDTEVEAEEEESERTGIEEEQGKGASGNA
ncbi:MAG: SMC-Scp complex subunit ScpB [Proteobacteria bacterium]|nr:SMC-Scp complex subunit ScpB [Pseudomonadota bacterium]MBI3496009.1 SMC-Scp complex subunit ScpB [Pseudomonadota bacterium]